jgi:catechol 2,3-dioxygenase-like lactoylglutathione lyase family enzyme
MRNLENLRKQAKQFVRWHRDRHWTVAEVIRATLPRYGQLSDGQIFEAQFRLADAQELVALRAGFGNWGALLAAFRDEAASEGPPASPALERPRLLAARPFVFVRDVGAACAYYVDVLGFELAFSYGNPAFYAEVDRDGLRLCVRHTDDPMIDPALARREEVVIASFEVTDAKALYLELQSAGAVFSKTLCAEPYGAREFVVDDPDGNRMLFFDLQKQPETRGDAHSADGRE